MGGSSHPRSRHHTAPRFPGLPPAPRGGEARPGPAEPWVHPPDQICFLGKFDLLLGPDTFQTLSPLFYCITFFKMGRGDPAVPRASLPLPVNWSGFSREKRDGGYRLSPVLLSSSPARHLRVPFPYEGVPQQLGQQVISLWAPGAPFAGGGRTHTTLPSSNTLGCTRRVTAQASELLSSQPAKGCSLNELLMS